ncbi:CUE domain-containing protein 2 isoform X1 [Hemiscyllium ocellatum]|uniref:CUE domain-containing protein 2 isoform X1 n=1 Tax=Hemiscyllium ocellatum TaxID=170820 RepID=UPI00296645B1|nr:CUE domain-containing protein 2 isoform X1 [Hemiscyllium ocellatum]XP_060710134.1 CUE domain-containing protein 2 isoform X1 [Hemiscyllium ocellatum]XP_060710135.1 CUE domain-containing protein 2 isoform X1 [Hemiscyllium ocellatum]
MALDKIIQDALTQFVQLHIPDADLSVMDEVILSYITSVLEELGSPDSSEENFDVEMFVEMMAAYVPGFAEISSVTICEMMFDLAARLVEARNKENVHPLTASQDCESFSKELASSKEDKKSSEPESNPVPREGASAKEGCGKVDDGVQLLVEMFPSCSLSVMHKALSVAKGNLDYAVQLIMEGRVKQPEAETLEETLPKADKKIKASILEKYMMVDNEDDVKTHKPIAPKAFVKLATRIHEHQLATKRHDPLSLIALHTDEKTHHFDWDNTSILGQAKQRHAREFLEAWHSNHNATNKQIDLDAIYQPLRKQTENDITTNPRNPIQNKDII